MGGLKCRVVTVWLEGWSHDVEGRGRRSVTGVQQGHETKCNWERGNVMREQRKWGWGDMASRFAEMYCMAFKHGFTVY